MDSRARGGEMAARGHSRGVRQGLGRTSLVCRDGEGGEDAGDLGCGCRVVGVRYRRNSTKGEGRRTPAERRRRAQGALPPREEKEYRLEFV